MRRAQSKGIHVSLRRLGGMGFLGKAFFRHPSVGNGYLSWYAALARSEPVVDLYTIPYGGQGTAARRTIDARQLFTDMREMC